MGGAYYAEADEVGDLFNNYMQYLKSGNVTLIISEQPDQTGFFKEAYLEAKGIVAKKDIASRIDVNIENVRIDSALINVSGLQLNPPSDWKTRVSFDSFQSSSVTVNILESDINSAIKDQEFRLRADNGKDFILFNVVTDITADGIKITGYLREENPSGLASYAAAWLLGPAVDNYPVEINSKLKIVDDRELWLDNPTVKRGSFSELDSYIERNITNRDRPILDLGELDLSRTPVTLHSVELKDGSLSFSSATLPKALEGGIRYTYSANADADTGNTVAAGTIEPVPQDERPSLIQEIVKTLADSEIEGLRGLKPEDIKFIESQNILAIKEPTEALIDEAKKDNYEIVGKLNTISVDITGYYVFKVVLSDALYDKVKDTDVKNLRMYYTTDDGSSASKVSASSVKASLFGLINTLEILTMQGKRLTQIGAKEFLMIGLLNAGKPLSFYLAKLILALLLGGCYTGFGVFCIVVASAIAIKFFRKR